MKVLGIIPARSGSKGVKDKNIRPLKGVPLLEYSIFSALEAKKEKILSDVILSTDSEYYLELIDKYNIYKDYLRPKKYAQDKSPTIDLIIDATSYLIASNKIDITENIYNVLKEINLQLEFKDFE